MNNLSVTLSDESLSRFFRGTFLVVLVGGLLYFALYTIHWPMMVNAPIMHYVNFLMSHGAKPYAEITDMNMPGAYLLERFGMSVFGSGDLGWRFYDYFLDAVTIFAMVVIAKPYDWLAGLYAGGLFALRHGMEGPWFSGEREQEMMVLIVCACALLFTSVRHRRPVVALGFGLSAGLAAAIKPTLLPFGILAVVLLFFALRHDKVPPGRFLVWSIAGLLIPALASVLFLAHFNAFRAFFFVLRTVSPLYVTLNTLGWRTLLRHALPEEWLILLVLGVVAAWAGRQRFTWEHALLWLAAGCGLASYLVQRKGFWYQRYMFLAFALLLAALALLPRHTSALQRALGYLALLYATLYLVPLYLHKLQALPRASALTSSMEADLSALGTGRLQRQVQCFDITFGCLNSLYHLQLVENTDFTGDLLLFPKGPNPAAAFYRALFWKLQAQNPADVIVFTNQEFGADNTYGRLARWPEFARYLAAHYHLTTQRSFPHEDHYAGQPPWPSEFAPGYRIYLRNGFAAKP